MRAIEAVVTGRVQGVWFRASTQREAQRLGLTGTVENVGDDRVRVVAQGHQDNLEALVRWLHKGPPNARVDSVVVREVAVGERVGFDVLR